MRNFTPSDDVLIRQQPTSGMSLKILGALLHTNRETLMRRADELKAAGALSGLPRELRYTMQPI